MSRCCYSEPLGASGRIAVLFRASWLVKKRGGRLRDDTELRRHCATRGLGRRRVVGWRGCALAGGPQR